MGEQHALTVEELIEAYTINVAWALRVDDVTGSIEEGKYAISCGVTWLLCIGIALITLSYTSDYLVDNWRATSTAAETSEELAE